MNKYGTVAVNTAELLNGKEKGKNPKDVWEKAANVVFEPGSPAAMKVCPKSSFLGLCESGLIKGVPAGKYTRSKKNKLYALKAVGILQKKSHSVSSPEALWNDIGSSKSHNCQMDVVLALWNNNYIIKK